MNDSKKLDKIKKYLTNTRKELDECMDNDFEYNTSTGNGVNCGEASQMFKEVEKEINKILDS